MTGSTRTSIHDSGSMTPWAPSGAGGRARLTHPSGSGIGIIPGSRRRGALRRDASVTVTVVASFGNPYLIPREHLCYLDVSGRPGVNLARVLGRGFGANQDGCDPWAHEATQMPAAHRDWSGLDLTRLGGHTRPGRNVSVDHEWVAGVLGAV